ncbi:MAG TPA: dihydrodipicolinate synthase family protein [Acidimicrobiales bacterium]
MTVGVMSITPFTAAGEVDAGALATHLERLGRHDVAVYLCSQGSGEGLALSTDEKALVYRTAVAVLGGRRETVGAGVGLAGDTASVVGQVRVLGATGVDAVQVLPPRTGALRPTDDEVARYYEEVVQASSCPIVVAENVALAGYEMGPALLRRVVDRTGTTMVNHTVPGAGVASLAEVFGALPPEVSVHVGLVHHLVNVAALGGAGILCFDGNLVPGLVARAWKAATSASADLLPRLRTLFEVNAALTRYRNPGSIKAALAHFGLPAGTLRRPLLGLDPADRAALAASLDAIDGLDAWF